MAGGDLAGDPAQGEGAVAGEVHRLQLGRGAIGDRRRRGNVAQGLASLAQARPPAADDAALDHRRPARLDQLLRHRRVQCLPGPRMAPRPEARKASQQRPDQRLTAEAAEELGVVLVDAEREPHPRDRQLQLLAASRLPAAAVGDRRRIDRIGAKGGAARARLPGTDQDRTAVDVQQPRRDPAPHPHGPVLAAAARQPPRRRRPQLELERASGQAGGRRPGRSGWRRRSADGGRGGGPSAGAGASRRR